MHHRQLPPFMPLPPACVHALTVLLPGLARGRLWALAGALLLAGCAESPPAGRGGQGTVAGHGNVVNAVAFSPDGKTLASGAFDGIIVFWDPLTGMPFKTIRAQPSGVSALAYSPDGRLLASAGMDSTIKIWEADSGREVHTLRGHVRDAHCLAFSPDGTLLAAGDAMGEVILWAASNWEIARRLAPEHQERFANFRHVGFGPEGKVVAGFSPTFVTLWEAGTGRVRRTLGQPQSQETLPVGVYRNRNIAGAISPDGRTIAVIAPDYVLRLYHAATGKEISRVTTPGGFIGYAYAGMIFPEDGKHLAVAMNNQVSLWDVSMRAGRPPAKLWEATATGATTHVALSPDGKWLACASIDHTVKIWNMETGRLARTLGTPPPPREEN